MILKIVFVHFVYFYTLLEIVRQWQTRSMNAPTIPEVKWEDIGGLQHIINELLATIQLPLRFPELIQNGLKRSGRVKIHQSLEKVKVKNLFSFFIGIML